jgi:hypothetical protein
MVAFIRLGDGLVDGTDYSCQLAGKLFYEWTQLGYLVVCLNEWCPSLYNPIDNDWAYRLSLGDIQAVELNDE